MQWDLFLLKAFEKQTQTIADGSRLQSGQNKLKTSKDQETSNKTKSDMKPKTLKKPSPGEQKCLWPKQDHESCSCCSSLPV